MTKRRSLRKTSRARNRRRDLPIEILRASSVFKAMQCAIKVMRKWSSDGSDPAYCWFRGVCDSKHKLLPGAYRSDSPDKAYDEFTHMVCLAQEGAAYGDVGTIDDWKTYYIAQHHHLPTRLLDWSDSFAVALFFAIESKQPRSPCVWILNPAEINKVSVGDPRLISPENNSPTHAWLPRRIREPYNIIQREGEFVYDNTFPLAIIPRKSDARMVAQQAYFTVHGRSKQALEDFVVERVTTPKRAIARIDLNVDSSGRWLDDLGLLGTRRHTIYPDLDHYVQYLREYYAPR